MLKNLSFIIISSFLFISCSSLNEKQKELKNSYTKFKRLHFENYSYTVSFQSFTGFSSYTTIYVQNNIVYKREYKEEGTLESYSYIEDITNLGKNEKGFIIKTLDEVYLLCGNEILVKDEKYNYINLSFFKNNLLKNCSYTPLHCADDCSNGINIKKIRKIK